MKRVKKWKCAQEEASDLAPKRTKGKADNERDPTFVTICYHYFPILNLTCFSFLVCAHREFLLFSYLPFSLLFSIII